MLKIDSVETRITNQYLWEINKNNKGHTCYSVGGSINLDFIIDTNEIVVKNLISELLDKKVGFCGICETPKYTIAYVDREIGRAHV